MCDPYDISRESWYLLWSILLLLPSGIIIGIPGLILSICYYRETGDRWERAARIANILTTIFSVLAIIAAIVLLSVLIPKRG
jgi:hypothetical protein